MKKKNDVKTEEAEDELKVDADINSTKKYFEANKEYHYNYEECRGDYIISTGSMILDRLMDGGIVSGLVRFTGPTETGKTHEAIDVLSNFLQTIPQSKGIYIKAEGRIPNNIEQKTGIKFVLDPSDWKLGSCLIFECNIYETVFDWLRSLILDRKNKTRYCIIIDSMDGLLPLDGLDKMTHDAPRVAAGAVMTSDFLKRTNLALAKRGHLCIMLAQVRSEIRTQYIAKDRNKLGGASGGNAAVHMPNWVLEFLRPTSDDYFVDAQGNQIGRYASINVCKSMNETTGMKVSYPIKFKVDKGSSIWRARESVDLLVQWEYIEKKGSWFSPDPKLEEALGSPFKVQGLDALYSFVENREEIRIVFEKFCLENILK